ncbi:hypothetical protein M404DRAFT_949622 [Pisolithus tinctorius Marx 270]|uniref:Uncharacterized protein n=1 Tax=Pisolithus tinctorius Marx 270 TaxID=870435 RepID=A0A0C3NVA5_PISTI|nr:hypothetical protein M404DRAFT_949622 [Pisolithus tinctorius Marx 270]
MSMWSTGIPGSSRFHSKPAFILRAIANDIFPALNVTDGSLAWRSIHHDNSGASLSSSISLCSGHPNQGPTQ